MEPIYELNICLGKVNSVKKIQEKLLNVMSYENIDNFNKVDIKTISTTKLIKKYNKTKLILPQTLFEYPKKYLITGENGVGKSVFAKLLMQFENADFGTIEYDGKKNIDVSESVCYVPQTPIIFNASYEDNVTLFNVYDNKNLALYESFFPNEILNNIKQNESVENLSGGEKQVIAFLRALCSEKKIIILDEPFSAMNNVVIDCFMKHINNIDKMMLIIAHNLGEYEKKFDENIVILQ